LQKRYFERIFARPSESARDDGGHFWHDVFIKNITITPAPMNATRREQWMQRWDQIQMQLMPMLSSEIGSLTPKLERLIHILEWVRIEEFVAYSWCGVGRQPHERAWLANAFVAKAVLGLPTTTALIERLAIDRALRRICGFSLFRRLPSEATFSRAFDEFAQTKLAERVHEAFIKAHLGEELIGHLSRDGTAIEVRERPHTGKPAPSSMEGVQPKKRGRPRKSEPPESSPKMTIKRQREQELAQMLAEIPSACDRGTKCNAQGYKVSWNGYKLHLDTADCGVPVSALLSSASMHDSRAAVPLSLISAERVTNLYDLMDAAYCSLELHEHCRSLGHVPLIDHNPRAGLKEEFDPADAIRYHERTVAERMNARLKDEFGGRQVMVKGGVKVMSHLMFGVLALSADQMMRLRQ